MVGKEGNWVGMGVADPGKRVILGLARVEYHEIAPGKSTLYHLGDSSKLPFAGDVRRKGIDQLSTASINH